MYKEGQIKLVKQKPVMLDKNCAKRLMVAQRTVGSQVFAVWKRI